MELHDLYDSNRNRLGTTMERGAPQPEGTYRVAVMACIFNAKGDMLLQQRQSFKHPYPNVWDVTAGGSAQAGETSQQAVSRELFEEVGIAHDFSGVPPHLTVIADAMFIDFYIVEAEPDIDRLALQYEEVQRVAWATREDALRMLADGRFIQVRTGLIDLLYDLRAYRGTLVRSPGG